jgi:hypothetical protein
VQTEDPFSKQIEDWLGSDRPKTLGELGSVFGEKSFAVAILLLMFLPALPLPTGGITHVFEAITVLLAGEMVFGRRTIWVPARWRDRELGKGIVHKAIPFVVRRIRWFERFSRHRGARLFEQRWFLRVLGLAVIALAVAAAIAPPFSGLDTIPAMGAVVIALGIILEDVAIMGIGFAIGAAGIVLLLTLGSVVVRLIRDAF